MSVRHFYSLLIIGCILSAQIPVIALAALEVGSGDRPVAAPTDADGNITGASCNWDGFRGALGEQESSNNYGSRNTWDYVGRYQFGESALNTIGWYQDNSVACGQRKSSCNSSNCEGGFKDANGVSICMNDWTGNFRGAPSEYSITTISDFLSNEAAQDAAFDDWMANVYQGTKKCHDRVGQSACGCTVTMSGILAAGHLGGPGGGCRAARSQSTGDGGSSTCTYLCKFADYEVPPQVSGGQTFPSSGNCDGCQEACTPTNNPGQAPSPGVTGAGSDSTQDGDFPITEPERLEDNTDALKKVWVATLQLMTSQLTTTMMQQVQAIGMFFDAKHQLEVQRDFQTLTAQAHKDYHPSTQMCEVGTFVRHLTQSEKHADLSQTALSKRILSREVIAGDAVTIDTGISDYLSRLEQFQKTFCNPADAGGGLIYLCKDADEDPLRMNRDIDFTQTVSMPKTLDVDFLDDTLTPAEEDIMALISNLFYHEPFAPIPPSQATSRRMIPPMQNMRSVIAMRGIARNSIANIIAEKTPGPESGTAMPFIRALISEFGLDEEEIAKTFGENPSYHAQMEILTKTIYQHPEFIVNLYDKPANVKRIRAAMRAIKLMQERDIHDAMTRREMLLSMILEIRIRDYQRLMVNEIKRKRALDASAINPE